MREISFSSWKLLDLVPDEGDLQMASSGVVIEDNMR